MNLPLRVAALLLIPVCLAAACSSATAADSESVADGTTANVAASSPPVTDATETADSGAAPSSSAAPRTLDDYLGGAAGFVRGGSGGGFGGGGFAGGGGSATGANAEQAAEEQRQIQQSIQICMQQEGFAYIPVESDGTGRFFLGQSNQNLGPAEYAATEGFGISTGFDAVLEGAVDFSAETTVDPNDEYVATLSSGEADAYQLALNGAPPERNDQGQLVDPETGEVLAGGRGRGFASGGCRGAAQTEVRGDFSALLALETEFAALDERIAADPRIAQIQREWADCIRVAGFTYTTEDEARADIGDQFRPLLFSLFGRGPGQGIQGGDAGDGSGADAGGGQGRRNPLQALAGLELTPEQDAQLRALQDYEIAVAVASLECRGDTAAEVAEITARYEAEFVEANRDVLESFAN